MPTKGLVYSKGKGRQPFQTWKQIEQRIKRGGLSPDDEEQLWRDSFSRVLKSIHCSIT